MTESEAIEVIQFDLKIGGEIHSRVLHDAVDVAMQALEEVQQYRTIGTLEELQDMKSNYFEALSDLASISQDWDFGRVPDGDGKADTEETCTRWLFR